MKLAYNPSANPMAKSNVFRMAKVTLKAGVNDLTDEQANALKAHPEFNQFMELGVFDEVDVETEVKPRKPRTKPMPILLEMPEK